MKLPDWWPAWLPERCGQCDCGQYGGHHVCYCRECNWRMWPPEHVATD